MQEDYILILINNDIMTDNIHSRARMVKGESCPYGNLEVDEHVGDDNS